MSFQYLLYNDSKQHDSKYNYIHWSHSPERVIINFGLFDVSSYIIWHLVYNSTPTNMENNELISDNDLVEERFLDCRINGQVSCYNSLLT